MIPWYLADEGDERWQQHQRTVAQFRAWLISEGLVPANRFERVKANDDAHAATTRQA